MKKTKIIDLVTEKLVYVTPSHAPVLVSTISPFNNLNLGSFEQFMICSNNPPRIILAIATCTDTYKNILDGSDFCIGIPTLSMINQILMCGEKLPRNVSEFDYSGLTYTSSQIIKAPRIIECSVNIECTLFKILNVGDHSLIIGNVMKAVIDEELFSKDKVIRRLNLNAPYYASSGCFFKMGKIINAKNYNFKKDSDNEAILGIL